MTDTSAAAEWRRDRDNRRPAPSWRFLPDDVPPPLDADGYGVVTKKPPEAAHVALDIRCAASLAGQPAPERSWLVRDLIPHRAVTILSGDGGVGKSLLALQLAVATAVGGDWTGALPEPGPVVYLSAEDDLDELHRRLVDIMGERGLYDLADLHIIPLAGLDAVLGAPDGRGIIAPTQLWRAVVDKIAELRPRLLIVDNLADAFAGNENSRPEARQFVGLLRGAAIEHDLAVVLIAHPSLTGLSTGSGTSGSTAWSNSVRSRLYLDRATAEDGDEPDPTLRVLKVMKANYAPAGGDIRLKWDAGRFRLDGLGVGGFDRMAAEQRADRVFLEMLRAYAAQDRDVSPNPSNSFAPTLFSRDPDAAGLSRKAFGDAMNRLFKVGAIKIEKFGPPSKQRSRIVAVD